MIEAASAFDAAAAWAQIEGQQAARNHLAAEVLPTNKSALFDALAAAGLSRVVVTFDGSGDSGQIESIDARADDAPASLPSVDIEIASPTWDGSDLDRRLMLVAEAIEKLAYDFLEGTHGGWEVNEGAFGEFTFDVAERAIRLDYHERVETSVYHCHDW